MSQTKSSGRKSKCSNIKRKSGKTNGRNGDTKWYLETLSTININNNNDTPPSTISTPSIDRPTRKLGKSKQIICNNCCNLIVSVSDSSDDLSKRQLINTSNILY